MKGCKVLGDDKSGFAEATRAAKNADVAIVVVGENQGQNDVDEAIDPPTDGEGHDVASLDLTGVQEDLVRAVYETGTPTVVVLVNGRPLSTRWTAEHVPAIVEAWRPGERGGTAVADVLFGNYNPSGPLDHHHSPPLRPVARLLQLQALQGLLDQPGVDPEPRLRGYAGHAALSLWAWTKLYPI